jgi:hypothetical protein
MSEFYTASELLERINNNDNRCTAKPYLLLLRRKMEKVVDGDYGGEKSYVENITGDYISRDTREELVNYLKEDYFGDENWQPDYSDITEIYVDEYDDTVNVFLTDEGYREHLNVNKHNLGKHDTYGIHAFRNKEIASVFNVIEKSAKLEQQLKQKDKRIDELQKALDIAIEAVEFYGDVNNWSYQQIIDDISEINGSLEGGKKARQAKQQIDEILKGEGDE